MDFFEFPEPPPEPPRERYVPPPWVHAPRDLLPGVVALELLLARTQDAAVCVRRLEAYPAGFALELRVLVRGELEELDVLALGPRARQRMRRRPEEPYPPPELLRFGIEFADGRKATNLTGVHPGGGRVHAMRGHESGEEPPEGPVITSGGGGGGSGGWRQELWVWPLPPPGRLAFVCEWPVAGIALTRSEIDAGSLLEAAGRAQEIFPG
jgi:hypothetical protein